MTYRRWRTKRGGRYVCRCGYKFWVTQVKDDVWTLLPQFNGPGKARRSNAAVPGDTKERLSVMRQWKAQQAPSGRNGQGAAAQGRRLGIAAERPYRIASAASERMGR